MVDQVDRIRVSIDTLAISTRGEALRKNPTLVEMIITEKWPRKMGPEKWDGKLPHQMVPGSAVPLLNLRRP